MPWRLIVFLISLLVLLVFAGFNMNNASDISFGFYELENVPIFVSLLFSFILGVLFAIPFAFFGRKSGAKAKTKETREENNNDGGIFKLKKKEGKVKKDMKNDTGKDFEEKEDFI